MIAEWRRANLTSLAKRIFMDLMLNLKLIIFNLLDSDKLVKIIYFFQLFYLISN